MRTLWRRLALGIAIAVGIPLAVLLYGWYGPGPSARVSDFTVEEGSSVAAVAGQLEKGEADILRTTFQSRCPAASVAAIPFRPANSRFRRAPALRSILDLLQHGKPLLRLITVTEGMPSIIVEEKLAANTVPDGPDTDDHRGFGSAGQLQL